MYVEVIVYILNIFLPVFKEDLKINFQKSVQNLTFIALYLHAWFWKLFYRVVCSGDLGLLHYCLDV